MKTIGIIAEYNPFHNGHRYQIEEVKKRTGAENIVIAMSGDFVQRGTPAFTDKYLRAQMALLNGADFVFEIPVTFACASAEYFALAGVSLLSSLGFVDGICFGAEYENLSVLKNIAEKIAKPSKKIDKKIQELTAAGMSYPSARMQALKLTNPEIFISASSAEAQISDAKDRSVTEKNGFKNQPDFLSEPNTILAIEYLKALSLLHSPLEPVLIHRTDKGYHSTESKSTDTLVSASAIRSLFDKMPLEDALSQASNFIPEAVQRLFKENTSRFPVFTDDFSDLLYYRLLKLSEDDLFILDMSEEIYHRIGNLLNEYDGFSSFAEKLKTKQYTYSRISRTLLHLLLDIKGDFPAHVPYARLLGFRREKSSFLRQIKSIPLITKPAAGLKQLQTDPETKALYEKDFFAANLYSQIQRQKFGKKLNSEQKTKIPENEFLNGPILSPVRELPYQAKTKSRLHPT